MQELCKTLQGNSAWACMLGDIYDGNVWKEFEASDGSQFVANPHNFMVNLNVDWFQPFTHLTDSVEALYLTIQNLPRTERYKLDNVILVGIIPGPK